MEEYTTIAVRQHIANVRDRLQAQEVARNTAKQNSATCSLYTSVWLRESMVVARRFPRHLCDVA